MMAQRRWQHFASRVFRCARQQSLSLDATARDVPCACTIQFLIRSNRLDAIVNMRSNDAIWGWPYDIFIFTMFQELLACELQVELGSYFHFAGSLHLYEQHFDLARRILDDTSASLFEMLPMQAHQQLGTFLQCENILRKGLPIPQEITEGLNGYWKDLALVLDWFRVAKLAGGYGTVTQRIPKGIPYSSLLQNLIHGTDVVLTA
jgi:hypothetical protein